MEKIHEAKLRNIRTSLRAAQSHLLDEYFLYKEFVNGDQLRDPILLDITSAIDFTKKAINKISIMVDKDLLDQL